MEDAENEKKRLYMDRMKKTKEFLDELYGENKFLCHIAYVSDIMEEGKGVDISHMGLTNVKFNKDPFAVVNGLLAGFLVKTHEAISSLSKTEQRMPPVRPPDGGYA